jgi:hypothetical protein
MTDDELRAMLRTWQAPRAPRVCSRACSAGDGRRGDGSFRERSGYRCRFALATLCLLVMVAYWTVRPGPRVCPTFSRSSNFNPES